MEKKIFIGIDGGGTKSSLIATDENMQEIFRCSNGPSNFLAIGLTKASANIINLVKKATMEIDFSTNKIYITIGVAGAGREEDAERLDGALRIRFRELNLDIEDLFVTSDACIALSGAFNSKPGALLISGTGSIIIGKNQDDEIHRVGGYGRIIGDEGSGYSIGLRALKAAMEYFDGKAPYTLLVDLLNKEFGITSFNDIISKVYKEDFDIASIVPVVLKAADQDDETAKFILNDEAEQLLINLSVLKSKLSCESIDIAFMGSLLTNDNCYSSLLKEKISANNLANITEPIYSPELGAIIIGRRRAEV